MKKCLTLICLLLITVLLLSACNFNTHFSDSTGMARMEALPKVEQMMAALTAGDSQAALALMHPDVKNWETALEQLVRYIAGRGIAEMQQVGLNVSNTTTSSGTTRQEKGTLRVVLDDGEQIYLSVAYVTEPGAEGFSSFQIVLGVV